MASFRSTVRPPYPRTIKSYDQWLTDPVTGAPIGIVNPNANGEDGQFYPIPVTAAQIAAPTKAMLADTNVTYALNVAPYTRYISNGSFLVGSEAEEYAGSFVTVPSTSGAITIGANAGAPMVFFQSLTIQNSGGVTAVGPGFRVSAYP